MTPEYTQGICYDGGGILRDGVMMTIDKVVAKLNELEKDKERLDWLDDHIKIRHTISISHCSDVGYRCSMSLQITCGIDAMASSVRQVIDNAKEGK